MLMVAPRTQNPGIFLLSSWFYYGNVAIKQFPWRLFSAHIARWKAKNEALLPYQQVLFHKPQHIFGRVHNPNLYLRPDCQRYDVWVECPRSP